MADAETPPATAIGARRLPVVYRWAYDYSVPGATEDFMPQNQPPDEVATYQGRPNDRHDGLPGR